MQKAEAQTHSGRDGARSHRSQASLRRPRVAQRRGILGGGRRRVRAASAQTAAARPRSSASSARCCGRRRERSKSSASTSSNGRRTSGERLGVVFQSAAVDPWLTVVENLRHHGYLYGLSRAAARSWHRACAGTFRPDTARLGSRVDSERRSSPARRAGQGAAARAAAARARRAEQRARSRRRGAICCRS